MIQKHIVTVLCALLLAVSLPSASLADGKKGKEKYMVYQIWGVDGQVSFEVIESKAVRNRGKDLSKSYKEAYKAYKTERKTNKKAKAPAKPKMKKLKGPFKSEEEADKFAGAAKKKWEEALAKQKGKKKGR